MTRTTLLLASVLLATSASSGEWLTIGNPHLSKRQISVRYECDLAGFSSLMNQEHQVHIDTHSVDRAAPVSVDMTGSAEEIVREVCEQVGCVWKIWTSNGFSLRPGDPFTDSRPTTTCGPYRLVLQNTYVTHLRSLSYAWGAEALHEEQDDLRLWLLVQAADQEAAERFIRLEPDAEITTDSGECLVQRGRVGRLNSIGESTRRVHLNPLAPHYTADSALLVAVFDAPTQEASRMYLTGRLLVYDELAHLRERWAPDQRGEVRESAGLTWKLHSWEQQGDRVRVRIGGEGQRLPESLHLLDATLIGPDNATRRMNFGSGWPLDDPDMVGADFTFSGVGFEPDAVEISIDLGFGHHHEQFVFEDLPLP